MKVLFVFGTRPEAIKLAPLVLALRRHPAGFVPRVCVTAQHRDLLDRALAAFGVQPDFDLDLMVPGQTLAGLTARVLEALDPVLLEERPDLVLVQGDTTTTFAAALAAFYRRIPVGHVEAGLRSRNLDHPFPEELNRLLTTRCSALHFAPTALSAAALRGEGVAEDRIFITGNTGIDALTLIASRLARGEVAGFEAAPLDASRKLVLVTAHRRENFGAGMAAIGRALRRLAARGDVQIVCPVHPNPNVRQALEAETGGIPAIHLVPPQDYVPFLDLMRRADLILTDSGGVQEEAPAFGHPILILRETTERPEVLSTGLAELVGTSEERIVQAASDRLDGRWKAPVTRKENPFGDGHASDRIADAIISFFTR